ncbi:MAG: histidine phosphatase family protein [Clostridia bacterium]|nr:histidine phosphatase family protein [Clostridia bacterium]
MKVYVIRHGESETNERRCYTGYFNAPLTEKGREDAKFAAEVLRNVEFDRIFASDLDRAIETCKIATGKEPETDELIREISVGRLENFPYDNIPAEDRVKYFQIGYADFGGESKDDFKLRIRHFMEKLERLDCDNVAVFSHGGWLIAMLGIVLDANLSHSNIRCTNCAVGIFDYSDGKWLLSGLMNK